MPTPNLAALYVLSGLVGGAAQIAPVPAPDPAALQLRAVNHRFIHAAIDADGQLIEALTHDDFLLTHSDGSWHSRSEFLAHGRQQEALEGSADDDVQVRLFGRVAVVHGVFTAPQMGGKPAKTRYTDVHLWNGLSWRLVSVQNTLLKDGVDVRQQTGMPPAHSSWPGQDPTGDDLEVVRALNETYVKAFREADVAWYGAHLAPDYVVVSGDGSFQDRAAALAHFAEPTFERSIKSFPVDKVKVRRFDDVALVHAENAYELKDGRKGVSRYTDIWLLQGGRWWCIAAHITAHKAPSP